MIDVLLIADDLTGALDSAIQFSARGVPTLVFLRPDIPWERVGSQARVVVVNTNSRHLTAAEAAAAVEELARQGLRRDVPILYKKIDSALRGNVGAELAALQACAGGSLYLLPAYPAGGRTTEGGVQRWNGVPVAETAYGRDPFEPVRCSRVADCIGRQARLPVSEVPEGRPLPETPGILVLDAADEAAVLNRCREILNRPQPLLMAGSSGLAAALAALRYPAVGPPQPMPAVPRLLAISGSLHEVSHNQMRRARERGLPYHRLRPERELRDGFAAAAAGQQLAAQVTRELETAGTVLLETAPVSGPVDRAQRGAVSRRIAALVRQIYVRAGQVGLLVFGGDTLLAVADALFQDGMLPLQEVQPGVPLSFAVDRAGNWTPVVSKSGGFGTEDVVETVAEYLRRKKDSYA